MGKTVCPNGHGMWDGDGKPVLWIFRVGFFKDFMMEHPDCILGDYNAEWYQIYDCVDDNDFEDFDGWYCDECGGVVIYVGIDRYDYNRMESMTNISIEDIHDWEEYIAMRTNEFEKFQEFCDGKSPVEAIDTFVFKYRYKVAPDKKKIYALDSAGNICFGYYLIEQISFSPDMEVTLGSGDDQCTYKPYREYKGRLDIDVKVGKYVETKDGNKYYVKEIIKAGDTYRANDLQVEGIPLVDIKHSEVVRVIDEVCKAVTIE